MLNVVAIMGRLTAEPEVKHTQQGMPVCSFTLAVERAYAKPGEQRQADFIDCVAWRNTAEFIGKYFAKGQMMCVQGSIQTRTYDDKQGNKRKTVEILAESVHFCGSNTNKVQNDTSQPAPNLVPQGYTQGSFSEFEQVDDDLPF